MTEEGSVTTVDPRAAAGHTSPATISPLKAVAAIVGEAAWIESQCQHLDQLAAERDSEISRAEKERAATIAAAEATVMAVRARANQARDVIDRTLGQADAPRPAHFEHSLPAGTFTADGAWTQHDQDLSTAAQECNKARSEADRYRMFTTAIKWAVGVGVVLFLIPAFILLATGNSTGVWGLLWGGLLVGVPLGIKGSKQSSLRSGAEARRNRLRQIAEEWWEDSRSEVEQAEGKAETSKADATRKAESAISAATATCDQASRETRDQIVAHEAELRKGIAWLDRGLVQGSWTDSAWTGWRPLDAPPSCVRIGRALPAMPRFYAHFPRAATVQVPALVNYRGGSGLLFESDAALREARSIAQNIVLRLLATLPAAAVRFVFIDPVSLGDNVASFMALERYESALIGGKAWSEPAHIDQALVEITEHMETVIQKYLRDDFKTIEEYNAQARVKEAYRVVVVFDFPVNFTDASARRLASIMRNGPRCGVFPIVIADTSKPLPYGFSLGDLEQFATVLRQSDQMSARAGAVRRYNAHLTSISGVDVIALTQQLQAITGLEAEAARRLGDGYGLPKMVAESVTAGQAVEIQRRLDSVGAGVGFTFTTEADAAHAGVPLSYVFRMADGENGGNHSDPAGRSS